MKELSIERTRSSGSLPKIKELLQKVSNSNVTGGKISQKIKDNETKIIELSRELSSFKEELQNSKRNLECKEKELKEQECLLQDLKEDKESVQRRVSQLEAKHRTLQKTKPSLRDEQVLERGKRKHKLYKECTGIRWDYSAPETTLQGYITNKKDYIQPIVYKGDTDSKILRELVWKDVERSVMDMMSGNENQPINK